MLRLLGWVLAATVVIGFFAPELQRFADMPQTKEAPAPVATPKPVAVPGKTEIAADRSRPLYFHRSRQRPLVVHARRYRCNAGGAPRVRRPGSRPDRLAGRLYGQSIDRWGRRRGPRAFISRRSKLATSG